MLYYQKICDFLTWMFSTWAKSQLIKKCARDLDNQISWLKILAWRQTGRGHWSHYISHISSTSWIQRGVLKQVLTSFMKRKSWNIQAMTSQRTSTISKSSRWFKTVSWLLLEINSSNSRLTWRGTSFINQKNRWKLKISSILWTGLIPLHKQDSISKEIKLRHSWSQSSLDKKFQQSTMWQKLTIMDCSR